MRHRTAEYEKVEDKVEILPVSAERIENRSDRVNYSSENQQSEQQKTVFIIEINRIKQKNTHPADYHIKHHLKLFKFFLIYECKCDTENRSRNAHRNTGYRKSLVIGEDVKYHQRYTRSGYQDEDYGVVNESCNLFCVPGCKPMVNRRAAVKNNHSRSENNRADDMAYIV